MATVTKGYSFGSTELVTNTKLHTLVDSATVTNIVNADVKSNAAIVDTKLAQISTYEKVLGASLGTLSGIASAAGYIPMINIASGTTGSGVYFRGDRSWSSIADEKVKISSNDTTEGYLNGKVVSGNGITLTENSDGGDETLSISLSSPKGRQLFTSSGTFTASAGMTQVILTVIGGGAGGAGGSPLGSGGRGGGGGASIINFPYTVTSGSTYTVTVGASGEGGAYTSLGTNGGYSQWVSALYRADGGGANGFGGGRASGVIGGGMGIAGGDGEGSGVVAGGGGYSCLGKGGYGGNGDPANGCAASGYGGGGGGGDGMNGIGGDGAPGIVIVEW